MKKNLNEYSLVLVIFWGAILFLPFLGAVHLFDWDEINFAENAREMLITRNYQQVQINFEPFWEKPPLFFWLQTISFKVFGINEFSARLPNALVGIIVLILVFRIGKRYFNTELAVIWVLCITGSFTPHLYYKSGIIDPIYNLFIAATIFQFYIISIKINKKQTLLNAMYAGLFLGAAIITKGPAALLICILSLLTYLIINKFKLFFSFKHILICSLASLIVAASWFGLELVKNGPTFMVEFVLYQIDLFKNPVAGHGQPFWYHPLVLFFGCFPISIFGLNYLFKQKFNDLTFEQSKLLQWSQILFWVVLVLFSLVKTKIVHYSSACYLPLTLISAYSIYYLFLHNKSFARWKTIVIYVVGTILGVLLTLIPLIDVYKHQLTPYIKDDFAVACLAVKANWNGYEAILGVLFLWMVSVFSYYTWNQKLKRAIYSLLVFISLFLPSYLYLVVPKIEEYSQGPAIGMLKKISKEDCYITTLGYKSYAHYFYGRLKPYNNDSARDNYWLKTAKIDKPAYFLLHVNDTQNHTNSSMQIVDKKGGFILMKRQN